MPIFFGSTSVITGAFDELIFPNVRLIGADDMLFWVYRDWVHQSPENHLDGRIIEDGKWQVSWKRRICMTTQCYNSLPRKLGRSFSGTLSVKIDSVRAWKWNSDWVVIFHSVIWKCAQGVNNAKHICACLFFWLDFCNHRGV